MTIGERIRQRREELELTQEELAQKCGYKSRSSINKIELSRDLPLKKIKLMADALDTPPSYLMGWTDINGNEIIEVKDPDNKDELYRRLHAYAEYIRKMQLYDLMVTAEKSSPESIQLANDMLKQMNK